MVVSETCEVQKKHANVEQLVKAWAALHISICRCLTKLEIEISHKLILCLFACRRVFIAAQYSRLQRGAQCKLIFDIATLEQSYGIKMGMGIKINKELWKTPTCVIYILLGKKLQLCDINWELWEKKTRIWDINLELWYWKKTEFCD